MDKTVQSGKERAGQQQQQQQQQRSMLIVDKQAVQDWAGKPGAYKDPAVTAAIHRGAPLCMAAATQAAAAVCMAAATQAAAAAASQQADSEEEGVTAQPQQEPVDARPRRPRQAEKLLGKRARVAPTQQKRLKEPRTDRMAAHKGAASTAMGCL
jgi:hypothetical protein